MINDNTIDLYVDEIAYLTMDPDVAGLKEAIVGKDCFAPDLASVSVDAPPSPEDTCDAVVQQAVLDYTT